ncbi:intradiol ring-cleavage dioxygenase [Kocuria palustris]|uniref:intradiol ring-cleavage dioxygenase n=1 Tax=Kocuria palustris TaxID=71999 RepID=UPI0019D12950|nr:intradiol ring-cleavage dioxygenase [Kocuria palustris]MBN6753002.1 intradiol ring-cleavage dioxygenase [Kocuria palustris]MBN6757997.1 intradiol ring-cleavage dioxygenase [Kocuria palustris]MBN6763025.1 intradiol ring-cleavage dioxygenase [Kocuria palustris]MBN6782434.1 intradiol ring-cleavage dioxygenase [Kocuria palustris]MBN6799996.1 intradiol ring-cleavage dioxygenase [Kocuria palustris]
MLFLRRSRDTASQDTATQGSMTEPPVNNENDPRVEMIDGMPHYQGRPLERPEDEVQDQGLSFDLQTLVSRRSALSALGLGATAFGLAACSPTSSSSSASSSASATSSATPTDDASIDVASEIPDETAGPYPGDGSNGPDVLEESGVVRSDIRSSFGTGSATAEGIPMTLEMTIVNMADSYKPWAGAAVYVWHCDRDGEYSMYSEGIEDENYLRGVQIADSSGKVTFTSIFPACYTGRWPHIHFEVFPDEASITDQSNAASISQIAIPQATCDEAYATSGYESSVTNMASLSLDTDNVFSDDGGQTQLATVTGDAKSGYTLSITVGVDTNTEPSMGGMGGGAGAPGAAPAA